jgi:hypothetical protein
MPSDITAAELLALVTKLKIEDCTFGVCDLEGG